MNLNTSLTTDTKYVITDSIEHYLKNNYINFFNSKIFIGLDKFSNFSIPKKKTFDELIEDESIFSTLEEAEKFLIEILRVAHDIYNPLYIYAIKPDGSITLEKDIDYRTLAFLQEKVRNKNSQWSSFVDNELFVDFD